MKQADVDLGSRIRNVAQNWKKRKNSKRGRLPAGGILIQVDSAVERREHLGPNNEHNARGASEAHASHCPSTFFAQRRADK